MSKKVRKQKKRRSRKKKPTVLPVLWKPPQLWWIGAILLITFLCFYPSLDSDFVNWDDDVNLLDNPYTEVLSARNIQKIFTTHVIGNYNPLSIFTLAIERHFFGIEDATPYHMTNVLLHLVCVLLVFRCMQLLGAHLWASALVALLFGIHPMRVESVTWVTERKDVLFAAFYFASFSCYLRYLWGKRKEKKWYWWALALFVPALLAKIQAVFLPLSMLAADYYRKRPLRWQLILEKWPFWLLSLATGLIGIYFLRQQGSLGAPSDVVTFHFGERLLIGAYSLMVYLIKFVFPYEMVPLYPYPAELDWRFYVAPLGAIGFLAAGWWAFRQKKRILVFGLAFFFLNVVMMLQILGAGQGFIADRFTYVPYFGLFFVLGMYAEKGYRERPKWRTPILVVGVSYLLLMAFLCWKQTQVWKDSEVLWTHVLKHYDKNATAWRNRSKHRRDNGDLTGGMADLQVALEYDPNDGALYNSLGKTYFDQSVRGRNQYDPAMVKKAIEAYDKAISLDDQKAEFWANRGAAKGANQQYQAALADLTQAIQLDPEHLNSLSNRSLLYYQTQQFEKARADIEQYLRLRPNDSDMWYEKALTLRNLGQEQEALESLNRAIQLNNTVGLYFYERARVNGRLNRRQQGLQDLQRARDLGLDVPQSAFDQFRQ